MPGTTIGGIKASQTNKQRHGEDFYKLIGAKGGKNGHTGGFYANRELASIAGKKGGTISRRGPREPFFVKDDDAPTIDLDRVTWGDRWRRLWR